MRVGTEWRWPVRLAVTLAALVGLIGLAAPVGEQVRLPEAIPSASTTPFETPDVTLSDLLQARPIGGAVAAAAAAPSLAAPPPSVVAATLFALAALLFVALRGRMPATRVLAGATTPRRGRAPPTDPNT